MYKVHVVCLVFSKVQVKHFHLRDFFMSFQTWGEHMIKGKMLGGKKWRKKGKREKKSIRGKSIIVEEKI